ncbi:MAG: hypothetical protein P8Y45_17300 [Exilibacterium sp.]
MVKELPSIVEFLGEIEDPRRDNANRRHEFIDILVIALCGMLRQTIGCHLLKRMMSARKIKNTADIGTKRITGED